MLALLTRTTEEEIINDFSCVLNAHVTIIYILLPVCIWSLFKAAAHNVLLV